MLGAEAGGAVEIGEPCSATKENPWDGRPAACEGLEKSTNTKAVRTNVSLFILMREYRRKTGQRKLNTRVQIPSGRQGFFLFRAFFTATGSVSTHCGSSADSRRTDGGVPEKRAEYGRGAVAVQSNSNHASSMLRFPHEKLAGQKAEVIEESVSDDDTGTASNAGKVAYFWIVGIRWVLSSSSS
jgi:hypothetical protein